MRENVFPTGQNKKGASAMSVGNKSSRRSVSQKMMSASFVMFALIILVFAVISLLAAKFRAESDSFNNMNNAASVISGIVSDYMTPVTDSASAAASSDSFTKYIISLGSCSDFEEMQAADGYSTVMETLDSIAASDKDVASVWLAAESGKALVANGERYISEDELKLTSLYWYNEVNLSSEKVRVFCSGTSKSLFDGSEEVVTVIAPIYISQSMAGYVGAEVKMSGLKKILGQYTLNSGCYPVITCDYGSVIYSPQSSDFLERFDINTAPLTNVLIQSGSVSDGIDSYSDGLKSVYFSVDNTTVSNWSVIVLFDSDILTGGLYKFCLSEIVILICLSAIAIIIIKNKLAKETSLVPRINEALDQLAAGCRYTIDTAYSGDNALTVIAEKINMISSALSEKNNIIMQYTANDTLTGLPNRMSLYNKIEELIARNASSETISDSGRFAVMFVDIDNFKWLNETLGHNFGDAVLCTFSKTLSSSVSKTGSVFRFSGDEFIILVEFGNDYNKIYKVINNLQSAFSSQIRVMADNIYIKFSVGVSIYPDDDSTADMLLRDADLALHKAKESGKDRVSFYTNASKRTKLGKAVIARQISAALEQKELYLNYQPIISTDSCDIHGFEVLLRWNSPEYGNIPPTDFINVAEETGDIVQIGMWIFENSCRTLKFLCDNYRDDIIMSINVSPVQLRRADYIETIKHVIEITQVNPKNIQLEITESTLIDFIDKGDSVIEQINNMGIALALDDFGTGYSSLNYLKNFPIKCLKIDKSFVDEINNNKRDQAITDSIIDLVHNLGIKTVAEGIETVGQYNFLKEMKCDYIQGFLMSKPLDETDALEFVERYDDLHKPDSRILEEHEKQLADERQQRASRKKSEQPEITDTNLVDGTISK
jgi:diguanylate cyclase (GGDEF)-like protein